MSFIRFSEHSDLYIYSHYLGYIECCGCSLYQTFKAHSLNELLAHVGEHRQAGHRVPEGFKTLLIEQVSDDDFTASEVKDISKEQKPLLDAIAHMMNGMSQKDLDFLDTLLGNPDEETVLEQAVRLARENQLNLFTKAIMANHSDSCYDGEIKKCTHEEDVQTLKETE